MNWTVTRILEADYGCEERLPDEPRMAIVYLVDENGNEVQKLMEDDLLYRLCIDVGSEFTGEV